MTNQRVLPPHFEKTGVPMLQQFITNSELTLQQGYILTYLIFMETEYELDNKPLADFLGISLQLVEKDLKKLTKMGYLVIDYSGKNRKIWCSKKTPLLLNF